MQGDRTMEKVELTEREFDDLEANFEFTQLANCTKVVRIFVIPNGGDWKDFIKDSPTRADVFVQEPATIMKDGVLAPKTWLGGPELVNHHNAHDRHWGTIPVLKGKYRDQIEWQCDVPFRVAKIEKVVHDTHGLLNFKGLDYPFMKPLDQLTEEVGGPGRPIRSGPTEIVTPKFFHGLVHVPWKQLYKAHFVLDFKGNGQWMKLDPDVYCEWH